MNKVMKCSIFYKRSKIEIRYTVLLKLVKYDGKVKMLYLPFIHFCGKLQCSEIKVLMKLCDNDHNPVAGLLVLFIVLLNPDLFCNFL